MSRNKKIRLLMLIALLSVEVALDTVTIRRRQEKILWFRLYLIFNDANLSHAENAWLNNHFDELSLRDMRKHNVAFCKEILSHGVSEKELLEQAPDAAKHLALLKKAKSTNVGELPKAWI